MLSEAIAEAFEGDELEFIRDALEYAKNNPYGAHKSKIIIAKLALMLSKPSDKLLLAMTKRRADEIYVGKTPKQLY